MQVDVHQIKARVAHQAEAVHRLVAELGKAIVGQPEMITRLLVGLLTHGHILLEGVPGLAKTTAIKSLAQALSTRFQRIQFTPDLLPADLIGTLIYVPSEGTFRTRKGPIFANFVLADEINRAPSKVQSALLEAMQERQVTIGDETFPLPGLFLVMATQNPIEQEGTYPLPEAQLDRFMFNTYVDYPAESEEFEIVKRTTALPPVKVEPVLAGQQIQALQEIVRRVPVADHVIRYALQLARLTRPDKPDAPEFVRQYVTWGAGPRASQYLVLGAKARAVLAGRFSAGIDDVRAVAHPVLRHRIITNFSAEAERVKPDDIVDRLLATADARQDQAHALGPLPAVFKTGDPGPA